MRDRAAVGVLAALLYIGFFKGSPLLAGLPIDLTVLGVACTAIAVAGVALTRGGVQRFRPAVPVLMLWTVFLFGVHAVGNTYGPSKTSRLYLITLVAALGAAVLLNSQRRLQLWVRAQIAVGALLAVSALLSPTTTSQYAVGQYRLALEGSSTIGTGRAAGVAVVGCLVLALVGGIRHRGLAVIIAAALVYPLIESGSRGPLASAVLAVIAVALFAPAVTVRRFTRVTLTTLGLIIGYAVLQGDTRGGAGRITSTLFAGNFTDTSSQAHAQLWADAESYIAGHPFGGGWGRFANPTGYLLGTNGSNYPHDVLLEVTGEAGWFAGLAVVAFLYAGLRRLRRSASDPYQAALYGIAVFFVLGALVSGDVNDNRLMWASVAVAWVLPAAPRPTKPARPAKRPPAPAAKVRSHRPSPKPAQPIPVDDLPEAWRDALGLAGKR